MNTAMPGKQIMKIIRDSKVIYDSATTKDCPPILIKGDEVEMKDAECFKAIGSTVYDVIEAKELTAEPDETSRISWWLAIGGSIILLVSVIGGAVMI